MLWMTRTWHCHFVWCYHREKNNRQPPLWQCAWPSTETDIDFATSGFPKHVHLARGCALIIKKLTEYHPRIVFHTPKIQESKILWMTPWSQITKKLTEDHPRTVFHTPKIHKIQKAKIRLQLLPLQAVRILKHTREHLRIHRRTQEYLRLHKITYEHLRATRST